ncbi:hypothetical protein BU15DRAFT_66070 [Melanogaster broomeanus]|nr:hypothetical protein BU15DRAFT_66070 [Melanogaster broomeanus]
MIPSHRKSSLLFLSTLISSTWADYNIDDTNTTLTYSSGPKAAWGPFAAGGETLQLLLPNNTYQTIDPFVCYNHTYSSSRSLLSFSRYAACYGTDVCNLTIPFTGSGIAIYVYQAGPVGINASITVDGAHAQTNVLNAPPAPAYQIVNVSMFDVQQLKSGPHTLSLLINDLFGSYSGMMFDYAYVNETLVTNPPTTTSMVSSTSSASATSTAASTSPSPSNASSESHTNVGAIVGGVIGGIALIAAGIIAFLWRRRRRQTHNSEMIDLSSEGGMRPYDPYASYDPPPSQNRLHSDTGLFAVQWLTRNRLDPCLLFPIAVPNQPLNSPVRASHSSGTQDRKTQLVLSNDGWSLSDAQPATYADQGQSSPEITQPPQSSRHDMSPSLTDEQADFINSLYNNNVPAAAIARVMERMLVDRHAGIREWERETRLARTNTMTTAPPSYDLVAERYER